ncbi:MAG: hypothetical protein UU43_C0001G0021 [Candidatus Falkowbacteria bacterium GW2011_GWA2_41_14]|uniref:Uncharacterized protein n=1 Tax=Candidatus Falkowbacteria bacterium GW2011_GWA2_41_14 TaxID=1618635 RepID=A0A0G0UWF2_9BACT|nr:MAG: hypothetical protein UU43_C0001G0021 [Candidatus Falkowbacteria bacterium GW2011_GWA2_41_14]
MSPEALPLGYESMSENENALERFLFSNNKGGTTQSKAFRPLSIVYLPDGRQGYV